MSSRGVQCRWQNTTGICFYVGVLRYSKRQYLKCAKADCGIIARIRQLFTAWLNWLFPGSDPVIVYPGLADLAWMYCSRVAFGSSTIGEGI